MISAEYCKEEVDVPAILAIERIRVAMDINKDQLRTALSFFMKNDKKPPINGIKNSSKTIISIQMQKLNSNGGLTFDLLFLLS